MAQVRHVGMIKEFMEFIKEYKILGLAIAFIMGVAANTVIKSLVDNIIMPPIGFALGGIDFKNFAIVMKEATATTPAVVISYGTFINDIIYFLIVAFVIFMIAKMVMKEEKVAKK